MTIELLFQRLKDGRVKLGDTFPVSERAWRERAGSECFVNIGDRMSVENLIQCIIVVSGNDSTVVVAEALGGTVEGFVAMMNRRARELGLKQSHFVNPDGLDTPPGPDDVGLRPRDAGAPHHPRLSAILPFLRREGLRLEQHPPAQPQPAAVQHAGRPTA